MIRETIRVMMRAKKRVCVTEKTGMHSLKAPRAKLVKIATKLEVAAN